MGLKIDAAMRVHSQFDKEYTLRDPWTEYIWMSSLAIDEVPPYIDVRLTKQLPQELALPDNYMGLEVRATVDKERVMPQG